MKKNTISQLKNEMIWLNGTFLYFSFGGIILTSEDGKNAFKNTLDIRCELSF